LCQAVKKGTKDKQIQEVFIEHIPSLVEVFEKENKKDYDTDLWSMDEDSLKVDYKRVKKWLDKFIGPLKDWQLNKLGLLSTKLINLWMTVLIMYFLILWLRKYVK